MESHRESAHTRKDDRSYIAMAFFLNVIFTIVEIVGGIWANSIAIVADAVHDFGDSLALGSAWYLERLSTKRGDNQFSYGYRRFSLLGALISAASLLIGAFIILYKAIPRLISPQPSDAPAMMFLAIIGVLVNGAAALRLMKSRGISGKMVMWHFWEDVLGWATILVVSIVLMFWDLWILDPLLSILITMFVLWNVFKNLKKTMMILLQSTPENIDIGEIEIRLREIEGVITIHHAHLWSLDGVQHVFSAHVVVSKDHNSLDNIRTKKLIADILSEYSITHNTLEIEYPDEACGIGDDLSCRLNS